MSIIRTFNVYCDESCHLEHDHIPVMAWGRSPAKHRCERIRWVPWMIASAVTHAEIDEWQNSRGSETNTLLWYREEYLVVLAARRDYWLLKTAYCTEQRGRIAKLQRERDAFHRAAGQRGPR